MKERTISNQTTVHEKEKHEYSLSATEMIDTPYLDGIQTHRGRVSSVIRPALYLQATTAGY